jgi:hypothetical protein
MLIRACDSRVSDSNFKQPGREKLPTKQTQLRDLAARFARGLGLSLALEKRGRRESRVHAAPAVSCANGNKKTHTSIQVQRRHPGFPCAMVFGLWRALPGERAFLPPSPPRSLLLESLTPASRRQDHTISPSASATLVSRSFRVHRIPHPTFVTTAKRPSYRDGMA